MTVSGTKRTPSAPKAGQVVTAEKPVVSKPAARTTATKAPPKLHGTKRVIADVVDTPVRASQKPKVKANPAVLALSSDLFDDPLARMANSAVYGQICKQVYGRDLRQFNRINMVQLDQLISSLALKPGQKVLDVGCGTGVIAEFLANKTKAQVHAVDWAKNAVDMANERTKGKRALIEYSVGDLNSLKLPAKAYDAITSMDTAYFARDLDATVAQWKAALKPNGRLAIFYTALGSDPQKTPLAKALKAAGMTFTTVDFTAEEIAHWKRFRVAAEQFKSALLAEGNFAIYQQLVDESELGMERNASGPVNRQLYIARVGR